MNNTKYTFLLPAYKAQFFEEALTSIKSQTYTDFKVMVSDDCSPEDLKSIYDKVCADDPRFTYRRNEENMGSKSLVSHWNLLVDMCDTEWLIMAGDDDVYDPTFLQEMDRLSEKYPQVNLLHARARVIDAEGEVTQKDALYNEYASQLFYISQYEYFNHIECVANNVYRTNVLQVIGCFKDFPLAWVSDTATNFLMSMKGVANSKDILFSFRMSGQNISSCDFEKRSVTQKKMEAVMLFEKFFEEFIKSVQVRNKEEKMLLQTIVNYHRYQHIKSAVSFYSSSLPFKDFIFFVSKFSKKGYYKSKYEIFLLFKRWIMKRSISF